MTEVTVMIYDETSNQATCSHAHRCPYLYGVAVDRLSSAGDVHCFGDLQDVVWHVAGRPVAVTNLPPLLPVVQNLPDNNQGMKSIFQSSILLLFLIYIDIYICHSNVRKSAGGHLPQQMFTH